MKTLFLVLFSLLLWSPAIWSQVDWTFIGSDPQPTSNFTVDDCGRYLTSTGSAVYKSEDEGETWTLVEEITAYDELSVGDGSVFKESIGQNGRIERYQIGCDGTTTTIETRSSYEEICDKLWARQYEYPQSTLQISDTAFIIERWPSARFTPTSDRAVLATTFDGSRTTIDYSTNRPIGRYFIHSDTSANLLVQYAVDFMNAGILQNRDSLQIPLPQGVAELLYSSKIRTYQPDTLVTAWTKDDGSGQTRIARYSTLTNEWEYQDLPFTNPISFTETGFRKIRLVSNSDIYLFNNKKLSTYDFKYSLQSGDSIFEYVNGGDELLAHAPNDQIAHYTENGIIRFDKPKFDSRIIEIQPLATGGVLGRNQLGDWFLFEEGNTVIQPTNFNQGYTISSDTLGAHIYEQIWIASETILIAKSSSAVDTLLRSATYTQWRLQGDSPTSRVLSSGSNFELSNGTLTPLRMPLADNAIGIIGSDTLMLTSDSFSYFRQGGRSTVVSLGYYTNRLDDRVYHNNESWFAGRDYFYFPTPHQQETNILLLDTNRTQLETIEGGYNSGFQQAGNAFYHFGRYRGSSSDRPPAMTNLVRIYQDRLRTQIQLPTHVYGNESGLCQVTNDVWENTEGYFEGAYDFAAIGETLYVSGIEGVFRANLSCINTQTLEQKQCLTIGDTLSINGLSITEPGVYLDTVLTAGVCDVNEITVYEENEIIAIDDRVACLGDTVRYGDQTRTFDTSGVFNIESVLFNSSRNCNVRRVLVVTVPQLDTFKRDTLLPIGSVLLGEEVTSNGQVISGLVTNDMTGCDNFFEYTVSLTSADTEPTDLAPIRLSPNPTNGHVTVGGLSPKQNNLTIRITDLSGRELSRSLLQEESFSLSPYPPGVYHISFTSEEGIITRRIVKQ